MFEIIGAIVLGILYGLIQGMIMTQDRDETHTGFKSGIRGHVLFGIYHFLFTLFCATLIFFSICIYAQFPGWHIIPFIKYGMVVLGFLFISWECSEILYPYIRWGKLKRNIGYYEHLVIADFYSKRLYGKQVFYAHFIRVIVGILLLRFGST